MAKPERIERVYMHGTLTWRKYGSKETNVNYIYHGTVIQQGLRCFLTVAVTVIFSVLIQKSSPAAGVIRVLRGTPQIPPYKGKELFV